VRNYEHTAAIKDMSIFMGDLSGSCSDPECCGGPYFDLHVQCGCGFQYTVDYDTITLEEVQDLWTKHKDGKVSRDDIYF
jgi:hypothetical protein